MIYSQTGHFSEPLFSSVTLAIIYTRPIFALTVKKELLKVILQAATGGVDKRSFHLPRLTHFLQLTLLSNNNQSIFCCVVGSGVVLIKCK